MRKGLQLLEIAQGKRERDMFEGFVESELSEEYPTGFSLDEFKNIRSYAAKMRYAEKYLGKPIGRGSSRMVYRVDETKVLKLVKNRKGVDQNEAEIDWYDDSYHDEILARVIDFDRVNGLWVEMELARRVKKSDFKRLWGVDFYDLDTYLLVKEYENKGKISMSYIDDETYDELNENDNVMMLVSFMYDSDSVAGDFGKTNSWGLVNRDGEEKLVLIDFGLTNNVYQSYYS